MIKLRFLVLLLIGGSSLISGCSSSQRQQENPPAAVSQPLRAQRVPVANGEELFRQYCSSCHPDGGNVSDPAKNLHFSALKANHINSAEDIVRIMRRPGPRMIRFDETSLSDGDAQAIAGYVWERFR